MNFMSKKRPLSDLFSEDVIVVLVSCTDTAAKVLRQNHNSAYQYNDIVNASSAIRSRTDRDGTPQFDIEPEVKILLKFSHQSCTSQGFTFGSDPGSCNILLDDNQKRGISRIHFYLNFDRESKALLVTDISSHGTHLTTQTFPKQDDESRVLNASRYHLSRTSFVLSENDEIRAGVVVLRVVVLRRPEPYTTAWKNYVHKVDTFMRQCDERADSGHSQNYNISTVLDPTILGSLGTAGTGSYAKVLKMIDSRGRLYGVKIPRHSYFDEIIRTELECMKKVKHKHIVSVVNGKTPSFTCPAIVMDYFPMTLQDLSSSPMSALFLKHIIEQILDALAYLHDQSIVHRDVKPSNILVASMDPVIKLADLGVSSVAKIMTTFCGTLRYKAPEIFSDNPYDAKADVWSAGIVLLECCQSSQSFQKMMSSLGVASEKEAGLNPAEIINSIERIEIEKKVFKSLLEKMLVEDPRLRASSRECLKSVPQLSEVEEDTREIEDIDLSKARALSPTLPMTIVRQSPSKAKLSPKPALKRTENFTPSQGTSNESGTR